MRTRSTPSIVIIGLAVLTSVGCTTVGHGVATNLAAIPRDRALVLFSTGASDTSVAEATSLRLVEGVSLRQYDRVAIIIDAPYTSDFADEHGHVRTLSLPAGKYYLVPHAVNPFSAITRAPVFVFEARSGEIAYLGNVFLDGNRFIVSGRYQQRDIDFFLTKNPLLKSTDLVIQPLRFATRDDMPTSDDFVIKGTIWGVP